MGTVPALSARAVAAETYRDAISHHPAGVAIVTAWDGNAPVGMTVSTVTSHSVAPPTLSCDLALDSATLAVIRSTGGYAIHLLAEDQADLAVRFAARATDRFAGTDWWRWHGLPVLPGVLARFACELHTDIEIGDHALVLGTVTDLDVDPTRRPLVHHRRGFHSVR